MKKYLSLFLCMMLLLSICLPGTAVKAAGVPMIVCEDVTCEAGDQITVNVTISNNPGFAYLELTPTYSPELTLISVANGTLISDFTKDKQYVWVADEDVTADGLLMAFTFDVAQTVAQGEYTVDFVVRTCANYNEDLLEFAVKKGTVTVGQTGPTEIDQFTYSLSGTEMTITGYVGEDTKVVIGSVYEIAGTQYTVTAVGEEAFAESTCIEKVSIPETVTEIGTNAFYLCENLTTVKLSEGLKTIGADAFDGCAALTQVTLPKSVELVDEYAFYDCTALKSIIVQGSETEIAELAFGYYYISRREDGLVENLVLQGYAGSTTQIYAEENGITFVEITNDAVVDSITGTVYASLKDAVDATAAGSTLVLLTDLTENVNVQKSITLDLNGCTVKGSITVTNGAVVEAKDTKTDDYTVEDGEGYGKITGVVSGVVAQKGYMMITENDGISFHRLNLSTEKLTLRASAVGMYYQSQFGGDEVIKRNIVAYGSAMGAGKMPDFAQKTYTRFDVQTWTPGSNAEGNSNNFANGTLLKGIMDEGNGYSSNTRNAKIKVYSQAYVELADGTRILGDAVSYSLQEIMEGTDGLVGADAIWNDLTDEQKTPVLSMYNTYKRIMRNWNIPNIKAAQ